MLMLVTCASCKADASLSVESYLNTLALRSGIGNSEDCMDNLQALEDWGIIDAKDYEHLDEALKYTYLAKTIGRLVEADGDYFNWLRSKGWISSKARKDKIVREDKADEVIDMAVHYINERLYEPFYDYEYSEEVKDDEAENLKVGDIIYDRNDNLYKKVEDIDEEGELSYRECEYEDVYESVKVEDSFEIDFSKATVIPYGEEIQDVYVNNIYELLASKSHTFYSEGFRVSYTLDSAGIDIHISKDVNGFNVYGDLSISNVKPSLKWTYEKGDFSNCYFSITMNTAEELGVSDGKYGNYHVDFKDLDSSSFMSKLRSLVKKDEDELEATIPICRIKTPIPSIPMAELGLDVMIKLYVSGKIELVLNNSHQLGFETRNGKMRYIHDYTHDYDGIIQASGKSAFAFNLNVEETGFRILDVELDTGLKAQLKSTIHLYDKENNHKQAESDIAYSTIYALSEGNNDVKVCGDVSLYYFMDLIFNTSKTALNKYGFTKTINIMDEDNQVFGNLHHIENGQFVKKCTRTDRFKLKESEAVISNRIVLDSYAEVMDKDETYSIIIKGLPEGYNESDISYTSLDSNIAAVAKGLVKAISSGSTRIKVYTRDGKYSSYVNILVSSR